MIELSDVNFQVFSQEQETPSEPPLVLIADDDAGTRLLLRDALEKAGYRVVAAKNGQEAINRLSDRVAAAVLDLMMPDIDGLECLKHIRRNYPDLSPIMLTASDTVANAVEAMKQGALDYVTKPFSPPQLSALMDKAIKSFLQARRLRAAEQKLEHARQHQLFVASQIQQNLLLGHPPRDFQGLDIAHLTIPSQQIDGDFYDFIPQGERILDLVVADVMGKGIMAAFMGAALKSAFLRVLNQLIPSCRPCRPPEPDCILTDVHAYMISQMERFETFVTLCYGRFDLERNLFTFVDCGHVRTIHYRRESGTIRLLRGANMPLGFPETTDFKKYSAGFGPGDLFIFYSDGVTEAADSKGELFDESRLVEFVKARADMPVSELVEAIRDEVIAFTQTDIFLDDFTCVGVRVTAPAAHDPVQITEDFVIDSDMSRLNDVRDFVSNFCLKAGAGQLDENRIAQVQVAANEVIANIIKHAYSLEPGRSIEICCRKYSNHIEIDFYDLGCSFDPSRVPPPILDGTREDGLGIYIIEQSVDEAVYFRDDGSGKNCARLKIMLSPPGNHIYAGRK